MIHATTITLLAILLATLPHTARTRCAERRSDAIALQASGSAERFGVPPAILLAIGANESMFACDPRSGGSWGAPVSRRRRGVAGTSDHAASALALGYRRCGTWLGAVAHFRCGHCRCVPLVGYEPGDALRLANRIALRTGAPALQ